MAALLSDRELEGMLLGAPAPPSAVMNWREAVARRVATAPPLPEVFDGSPGVAAARREGGPELVGWAASPGRIVAIARVIEDFPDTDRLNPGEVLVATATDPSWSPAFVEAAAVVLETGGPLSHAAILAREFGIPAVLNVPAATREISDGEEIEVDGFAGRVRRLRAGEGSP
jgi:pyruvate,water dikinase